MKIRLICVLLIAAAFLAAVCRGQSKSSQLFPWQYNADTLMDAAAGPYTNDTIVQWSNAKSHYTESGIAVWTNTDQCLGAFIRHKLGANAALFDVNTGFTIEIRAAATASQCDENYAKWGIMLETADNALRLDMRIYAAKIIINGTTITSIGTELVNAADFNTVRVAYTPGDTKYTVWINNIFVIRSAAAQSSPMNRFYFGDLGSAQQGMINLDYIRLDDTGSYEPQINIAIEESDGKTELAENTFDSYTIAPLQNPSSPFSVVCTPDNPQLSLNGQAAGSPCVIEFSPAAQGSLPLPQTVSVTAVFDNIRQNRRYCTISHSSASSDPSLSDMVIQSVNVTITPDGWCGQSGTVYNAADINRDCQVNIGDVALMASQWLKCTTPSNPDCDFPAASAASRNIFGTIYNYDGDFSFSSYDTELAAAGINMLIDSLAGTSVKSIAYSIASGSDIMNYPSAVSSTWGWRTTADESNPEIAIRVAKGKACVAAGMDAVNIAAIRAKQNAMLFFPSLRMNDYHFVSNPQNSFLTGKFWIDNQNTLTIKASGGKSPIIGRPECENLLDFTYPQVRQFRLDVINEVIDRNADVIDGFELDFSRSFVFFPKDRAQANAHLMTELVRQVRSRLSALESQYARQYYLIARIPPTIAKCQWAGIDIEQWLADELVDVIVPSELMTTYFEMPVDEFAALCQSYGGRCKVYGGLYSRVGWEFPFTASPSASTYASSPSVTMGIELTRAAAANFFNSGAAGIYCYNFGLPRTDWEIRRLAELDSAYCITGTNKVYPVTKAFWLDYEDTFLPPKQLPAQILPAQPLAFEIATAEQTIPQISRNALKYCGIRIGFRNITASDIMMLKINGQVIHSGELSQNLIEVTAADPAAGTYSPAARAFWQTQITDTSILQSTTNLIEITFSALAAAEPTVNDINIGFIYNDKSTAGLYVEE